MVSIGGRLARVSRPNLTPRRGVGTLLLLPSSSLAVDGVLKRRFIMPRCLQPPPPPAATRRAHYQFMFFACERPTFLFERIYIVRGGGCCCLFRVIFDCLDGGASSITAATEDHKFRESTVLFKGRK